MSLRLRLTLTLGSAFVLLWALAATWMLFDVRNQLMQSLDQRLAASARMVAGLLVQLPQPQLGEGGITRLSAEQLGIENGLACQISSLRGEILARSHAAPDSTLDAQRTGFHDQMIGDTAWRSFTFIQNGMRITTADRLDERTALQRSVLLAAALPVFVALLGSLIVLWIGIGNGLAPLRRIRTALAQRSADSVEPLHIERLPRELTPLVETQNQLFARIAHMLERERRLTDDAAHELRSPLTAIKTHLQVAAMTEGDTAKRALAQAEVGTDRLHRILEQLLMLARVEGRVSFNDGLSCTALDVAQLAIADASQQPGPHIELCGAQDVCPHPLAMPPTLAVAALRNLLDNARRHTRHGTAIRLTLSQLDERRVRFSVQDHGPAIPPEMLERLTERFWRSGEGSERKLAGALYHTLFDHYLPLGDRIEIYPCHGAGSACGKSIGDRRHSTLGSERLFNPALREQRSEDAFIDWLLADMPEPPRHYARLKKLNLRPAVQIEGPALPPPLAPSDFEALAAHDMQVVDVRSILAFGGGHVPGAVNIALRNEFVNWAGRMLDDARPILLVGESADDVHQAVTQLYRIGLDDIRGYLRNGMTDWQNAALPLNRLQEWTVHELNARREAPDVQVLDVRSPQEVAAGRVPGARHIFVAHLADRLNELDPDKTTVTYCGSGYRASIAASILKKAGFRDVANVPGSWMAWKAANLPVQEG